MWKLVLAALAAVLAVGSAALVGGLRDVDVNDTGVQNALSIAVNDFNKVSNDVFLRDVSKVVKVQSQVVSGMKYFITAKLAKTNCRKGSADAQCGVHEEPHLALTQECKFTVWIQPWTNTSKVLSSTCGTENQA